MRRRYQCCVETVLPDNRDRNNNQRGSTRVWWIYFYQSTLSCSSFTGRSWLHLFQYSTDIAYWLCLLIIFTKRIPIPWNRIAIPDDTVIVWWRSYVAMGLLDDAGGTATNSEHDPKGQAGHRVGYFGQPWQNSG